MEYQDLVDSIRDNLAQYRYTELCEAVSIGGVDGVVVATPRRMMVRYLCGVFVLPDSCGTADQAKETFEVIRTGLTKRYARPPYWKELGTYSVWMCGSRLYDDLKTRFAEFKDKTGLHMNVMLGSVFVEREKFRNSAASTWGLYYSCKHFGAISATVNEWCKRMRGEQDVETDASQPRS